MDGETSRALERVRFWIIVLTVLALVVPMVVSYRRVYRNRYPSLDIMHSGGDAFEAHKETGKNRKVNIYIGDAARDITGGRVATLTAPDDLKDLADRPSDEFRGEERPALVADYLRHAVGAPLIADDSYDVILSSAELAELRRQAEFVDYYRDVVAVMGGSEGEGVTLFTDSDRYMIYVVPDSLVPER